MKKLTALILAALMILSALPMMSFGERFDDIADGKWYSDGISFCAANGYMAGTSETVFDRNAELTRAMFMTILAKVDGADLAEYEGKSSFADVKTDGWYTAAIEWAYQNKLASGMGINKDGDLVFGYKNPVTREQMSVFFYGYAEYVNLKAEYGEDMPDVYPLPTPPQDSDSINKEPVYKSYEEVYAMIAGSNHRDIGELQSETQEMVSLGGYFSQYYQSYVSSTHDVRYVFVSSEEYEMEAAWDWLPVGTRDNYSLENLGKEVEDQSGLESFTPPIDTTLRADLSVFKDADRVHEWAKGSMEWAVACGLFSGVGEDILDPRGNCTRAQAAVLIRAFVLNFLSDCEHEWIMPTCLEGGYCSKCELKYGYELGHDFPEHYCNQSVKCKRCNEKTDVELCDPVSATCTTASYCEKCGMVFSPPRGHSQGNAGCLQIPRCVYCGIAMGDPIPHTTKNGECYRCRKYVFESLHNQFMHFVQGYGSLVGTYRGLFDSEEIDGISYGHRVYTDERRGWLVVHGCAYDPVSKTLFTVSMPLKQTGLSNYTITVNAFKNCIPQDVVNLDGILAKTPYLTYTGGFNVAEYDRNGYYYEYSYDGPATDKSIAAAMASFLLPRTLTYMDLTMNRYTWLQPGFSAYGFNMDVVKVPGIHRY